MDEMTLSPREVSILALLAQKAETEPVNWKELGLSEVGERLAKTLLSKKTASQSKTVKSKEMTEEQLRKAITHMNEGHLVGEFQRLLEKYGIYHLNIFRDIVTKDYFVNVNSTDDDGVGTNLIDAFRDARDISEYEENQNKEG